MKWQTLAPWRLIRGGGSTCNARATPWLPNVAPLSPATPTTGSWSQQVLLGLLILMVPFVRDKSAQIVGTLFHAKTKNFASRSEPNGALFWDNCLKFIIVAKNTFQQYIIYLCLKLFAKSHFFDIVCELIVKVFASFCMQGQLGLGITNRDHSRTCSDAMNPMTVSNFANEFLLKITFFDISLILSIYVKL